MIERIHLKNFLSYEDVVVDLTGATIAITGENGAGKSSLLEAIPYVYYGISRDNLARMSRINGDGSHEVTVSESGNIELTRGRKTSGKGYFEIRVSGELVADGAEGAMWVRDHVGMDADTYMLTAFFGLHDVRHDTLIRVQPAARLEALQKIAEIGPYKKFLKEAKRVLDEATSDRDIAEAEKRGVESTIENVDDIRTLIEVSESTHTESMLRHRELKKRKEELLVVEDRYRVFVRESSVLSTERNNLDRSIEDLERKISSASQMLKSLKDVSSQTVKEREALEQTLHDINLDEIQEHVENAKSRVGEFSGRRKLLQTAITYDGEECPLCHSPVEYGQMSQWSSEIDTLSEDIASLRDAIDSDHGLISRHADVSKKLQKVAHRFETALKDAERVSEERKISQKKLAELRSEKEKKDIRFEEIQSQLDGNYNTLTDDLNAVDFEIEREVRNMASQTEMVKQYKERLKNNVKAKRVLSDCKERIKDARLRINTSSLLVNAWNRYGIPMRLVKHTMERIEALATAVYQEFSSGRLCVVEVEDRGKPGVQFILEDQKGSRTFNQLSAGEKVMFFISVRVAISQIVSYTNSVGVDYLILDEAMGNLSPNRRDALIRLINKVLRKMFPQVVMVSHTEMRDIFSQTITVSSEKGISTVEVS